MAEAMKVLLALGGAALLAACGNGGDAAKAPAEEAVDKAAEEARIVAEETVPATLADFIAGPARAPEAMARDQFRNPAQTLEFFGLEPDMAVIEVWPGGGWYTDILAPYMASGGGTYVAAGLDPESRNDRVRERAAAFAEKYRGNPALYGNVAISAFSGDTGPIVEPGTADMVLTFRNIHSFHGREIADKAFADFYEALKAGGTLGVVTHRAADDAEEPVQGGYVRQDFVIGLAETAGFEFVESAEINANPADTKDHPFGVWTLPPVSRTTDRDGNAPEGFDAAKYLAIGESDRMTLKFRKPLTADGAMLE